MSASCRPSLGASAIRIIALYPLLSALLTNTAEISRLLYSYQNFKKTVYEKLKKEKTKQAALIRG